MFPSGSQRSPAGADLPRYAGVHLSGPNAARTALVTLAGEVLTGPLRVGKVYEKIGAFGTLFSDERLFAMLGGLGPFQAVFVDCPLTVPPCVACTRPVCPGAVQCEDVTVAYMLSVSGKLRRRGARKARPINPQSQRLWDIVHLAATPGERPEPSYSANLAPLVTRARTLQRRLNAMHPPIVLGETSVMHALESLRPSLGQAIGVKSAYRDFEDGIKARERIIEALVTRRALVAPAADDKEAVKEFRAISETVETFHAFITALVAALSDRGLTGARPATFPDADGWVHLPALTSANELRMPVFE